MPYSGSTQLVLRDFTCSSSVMIQIFFNMLVVWDKEWT